MIHVMHIITRMDMGGSAQNTLLTCLGLDKSKYRVTLVAGLSLESRMTDEELTSVNQMVDCAKNQCVDIVLLSPLVRSIHPAKDLLSLWALWRIARREKPDIVHTHTSKAGILGRWAAWLARVPVIIHTPHGHVFYGHFADLYSKLFLLTERLTAPLTHSLIALTKGEKNDYSSLKLFDDDRMQIIHSGVDLVPFHRVKKSNIKTRKALGIPESATVVGTVGWLLPIKNPHGLLEAMVPLMKDRPDLFLVFVGKGDLEPVLKQNARQSGVAENVIFTGWRQDIPDLMQAFDVFVLPSFNEGMGRVVVEAMASGKPVVAANVGGIPDMIRHGANGFLVDPKNVFELTLAVEKLLDNARLRDAMGQKGRSAAERFSLKFMISKIDALYESFSGGRN